MDLASTCDFEKHQSAVRSSFLSAVAVGTRDLNRPGQTFPRKWREPIYAADICDNPEFINSGNEGWQAEGLRRYFHLLSDREVLELRPVAEIIIQRQSEIVSDLYEQYHNHFGGSGTFSRDAFTSIFKKAFEADQLALLDGDIEKYTAELGKVGESLTAQRVGLDEVIALLHLFKDSVRAVVAQQATPKRVARAFDKLIHIQIILLVSAYARFDGATGDENSTVTQSAPADLPVADEARFHGLVGATPSMRQLYRRIEAAATGRGNLLIVGESGTGKELVARAVHECSARAGRPFVALNCAALPKDLIESELFGYKRGAFSGASSEHPGLFRAAEGGTLFLDEITEMSAETQSKLLRAIQERAIRPIGATREQPIDVRVIASTNREPQAAVADGHLRQDLYYRLQAVVITVPPLRERREDIPLLVEHFISLFQQDLGRTVKGIERKALNAFSKHNWPGNVRELSNAVEGAFTFGRDQLILLDDLPPAIAPSGNAPVELALCEVKADSASAPVATFAETERALITRALQNNNGNKVHAAAELKISRKKLYAKIAKYGLCAVHILPATERNGYEASH